MYKFSAWNLQFLANNLLTSDKCCLGVSRLGYDIFIISILISYSTGILPFFRHQAMQRLCLPRDILRHLVLVQLPKSNGKKNGKNKKLTLLRVKRSRPKGQKRYNNIRGTY